MKRMSGKKGFTLVEMVLVVAIIVILSAVVFGFSVTAVRDYTAKAELHAKQNGEFESGAFSQMGTDFSRENPPTVEEYTEKLEDAELGSYFSSLNLDGFNMAEANLSIDEQTFIQHISEALGTDAFFAQLYENSVNNTRQLFVYTGGNLTAEGCPKVSDIIVLSYTEAGDLLWSGTANAIFDAIDGSGISVRDPQSIGINYNNPDISDETTTGTTGSSSTGGDSSGSDSSGSGSSGSGSTDFSTVRNYNRWNDSSGAISVDFSGYSGNVEVVFEVDGTWSGQNYVAGFENIRVSDDGRTVTATVSSSNLRGYNVIQYTGSDISDVRVVSISSN